MLFNSYIFLLFLVLVIPTYRILKGRSRTFFLLACSYFFYGYWDWRFCSLLLISTVADFLIGQRLFAATDDRLRKRFLWLSMGINLGILGFFKYFNFFVDSFEPMVQSLGGHLDFLHLNIILPVGISFYTFQTMSYTIDIYRKRIEPTRDFWSFALFVAFFPQLVAGPIERAADLLPRLEKLGLPTREQFRQGMALIVTGMFKKVMLGDTTGRLVDPIFAQSELYRSDELLFGLFLFSIQIYADFSGYSSIARGLAKLLGVELMHNFQQPYLSSNITEFWRRWHISLSSWLKDYLYISLGGNRQGTFRTHINLMTTMLLGGLWHGSNWTFVIWGGLHGTYLILHKLLLKGAKPTTHFEYQNAGQLGKYVLKVVATFLLVLLTWLFFRAEGLGQALEVLSSFVHWETGEFSGRLLKIALAFLVVTMAIDIAEYYTKKHTFLLKVPNGIRQGIMVSMALITLLYLFQAKPLPFVYFQF
ncbi:MAG: MBOAT family O-acyltransferase [Salibacteraceae bacterium]